MMKNLTTLFTAILLVTCADVYNNGCTKWKDLKFVNQQTITINNSVEPGIVQDSDLATRSMGFSNNGDYS